MEEIDKFEYKTISITKAFTTGRKSKTTIDISRKGSTVKEKCKQLTEMVFGLCENGIIKTEDLEALIEDYCGADKETVRAYIGYSGRIRRSERTGEGYVVGEKRKGYLEKFRFMHRINRDCWRVNQTFITSFSPLNNNKENSLENSANKNFSISPILQEKECQKTVLEVVSPTSMEIHKRINNNNTEKERNFVHSFFGLYREGGLQPRELTPEAFAILKAKPLDSEPDRGKIKWSSDSNE